MSVRKLVKDWRLRVLAPVILIHALAFALLYSLLYHLAIGETIEAHKHGAETLFDVVMERFEGRMLRHAASDLKERFRRLAAAGGYDLALFNAKKELVANSGGGTPPYLEEELRSAQTAPGERTAWFVRGERGFRLNGVRVVLNRSECQRCHGAESASLGAIHMSVNLTGEMESARKRLLVRIGLLLVAWVALAAVMFRLRDAVIGRPLARIEDVVRSITRHRRRDSDTSDLESLAGRLNKAIRSLLEEQKRREASMHRQFARAEQMAALGELAAGLTHEIRNPLAGVSSALQLLRSEEADPASDSARLLDQTLGELNRASSTLDRLLRLARPEPPVKSTVDLAALARDVARLFEPRLRGRNVSLAVEAQSDPPALRLDRGQMTQLLLNLLTNSAQAVGDGGAISVRLAPFPDGDGVILSVSDDGAGIPAEQLEKIWEPFFTTKDEGTGLGLPICRQIAELHGGTITVESAPGEGTTVLVLLPTEPSEIISAHGADPDR